MSFILSVHLRWDAIFSTHKHSLFLVVVWNSLYERLKIAQLRHCVEEENDDNVDDDEDNGNKKDKDNSNEQ